MLFFLFVVVDFFLQMIQLDPFVTYTLACVASVYDRSIHYSKIGARAKEMQDLFTAFLTTFSTNSLVTSCTQADTQKAPGKSVKYFENW